MIKHLEVTSAEHQCDFPHCFNSHRRDVKIEGEEIYQPESPEGWERVRISDHDDIHLCPDHAQHKDVVELFVALQKRADIHTRYDAYRH